eukprot:XP_016857228.1 protein-cysteine N-palmitoyltransferase HHAT isoform X17 [Homo sapiens]
MGEAVAGVASPWPHGSVSNGHTAGKKEKVVQDRKRVLPAAVHADRSLPVLHQLQPGALLAAAACCIDLLLLSLDAGLCLLLSSLTQWAHPQLLGVHQTGGLALAQVLFFYVKYLVLFGVPALLMRLDGLTPPALPRCVSTMFSFTGMWRYFDVGLHNFLIRYVYIPVGGSQHGLLGTLFSTAMTFAFVSYWHGGYDYLWCWAALNWLGVTVENGVRRLVETPCIQDSLARYFSPQARRRFHAALASCSTSMLILSNLVFLGGNEVGKTYWNRIFIQGGLFLFFLLNPCWETAFQGFPVFLHFLQTEVLATFVPNYFSWNICIENTSELSSY